MTTTKTAGKYGVTPFALLKPAFDTPFTVGVQDTLQFDTVVFATTPAFGAIDTLGSGDVVFTLPFGIYVVTLQVQVDTSPTILNAQLRVESISDSDITESTSVSTARVNCTMVSKRTPGESPTFSGASGQLPCFVLPLLTVTGGINGSVLSAGTRLGVQQICQF